jgi:2-keto-4-pentenoate hydratase/2-oxohepta-3-ene-1,7-dioic acid hydratase in catechol pathway
VRIANVAGRAVLLPTGGAVDLERASRGRLPADPLAIFDRWDDVVAWSAGTDVDKAEPFGPPISGSRFPRLRQVFAEAHRLRQPHPVVIELYCAVNGVEVPHGRTSEMLFSVSELIAYLSTIVSLCPGDLIFTVTPDGVGITRQPPCRLAAGDELVSHVAGIGELRQGIAAS